jgi:hypothetical protein
MERLFLMIIVASLIALVTAVSLGPTDKTAMLVAPHSGWNSTAHPPPVMLPGRH